MRLTAWEEERLLIFTRGRAGAPAPRRGPRCSTPRRRSRSSATRCSRRPGPAATTRRSRRPGARPSTPTEVLPGVRRARRRGPARGAHGRRRPAGRARSSRSARPVTTRPARSARPDRDRRTAPTTAERLDARGPQHLDPGRPGLAATTRSSGSTRGSSSIARRATGFRLDLAGRLDASAGRPARRGPSTLVRVRDEAAVVAPPSGSPATARRPATGSASATPTCGSASSEDRQAPGDEPIWGYAKTIRPRVDPGPAVRLRARRRSSSARSSLDPVLGVVKADIGIKDGRIVGVGRAGNAGDQRRHRPADRAAHRADHGLRPHRDARRGRQPRPPDLARSSCRPRCRAASRRSSPPASRSRRGRWRGRSRGIADWPLNVGLQACARAEDDGSLDALLDAGACGFKIHEDYGAYPELIDRDLRFADAHDVSVVAAHRRPARERRARGHGRGHRRPDRPRLPRRGQRRRPRARRHRPRPRAEHHLLVDDADRARGASTPPPSSVPMIVLNHGASFGVAEDVALVARARPPGDDGRRGAAPRARRDRHRQLATRRAWAGSWRRSAGRSSWPTSWRALGRARSGRPTVDDDRAGPALPRQGDHRAGDHPRHRRPRRLAPARPPGRHRPVAAGLLRRQAGARAQGRACRPGRRSARATPRSRAPSRRAIGPTGAGRRAARVAVGRRSCRRGGGRLARDAAPATAGALIAVRGTRGLTRDVAASATGPTAAIEVDVRDGPVTLDGRPLAVDPVTEVPLSRRYLLR